MTVLAESVPPTLAAASPAESDVVRVTLHRCPPAVTSQALSRALSLTPAATGWRVDEVTHPDTSGAPHVPHVVVCPSDLVEATVRQEPAALVVAVVSGVHPGEAVRVALRDGAATCVPGDDPRLIAAFVVAVLRRQGLVGEP